eukprot:8394217-Pyramimonas_sp.AAC.1
MSRLGLSVELPAVPRNVVWLGADACERRHWCLRWGPLWGHQTLCWVGVDVCNVAAGVFGGAPYEAITKR